MIFHFDPRFGSFMKRLIIKKWKEAENCSVSIKDTQYNVISVFVSFHFPRIENGEEGRTDSKIRLERELDYTKTQERERNEKYLAERVKSTCTLS